MKPPWLPFYAAVSVTMAWIAPGSFTLSSILWTAGLLTPWFVVGPIWFGALKAGARSGWAEWKLIREERR